MHFTRLCVTMLCQHHDPGDTVTQVGFPPEPDHTYARQSKATSVRGTQGMWVGGGVQSSGTTHVAGGVHDLGETCTLEHPVPERLRHADVVGYGKESVPRRATGF